jgi:phosphoenolpyruvate carboxykinase (ATP)
MLGDKIEEQKGNVSIWLVNTGWSGGAYGVGSRIILSYTRAMIKAALNGVLKDVKYRNDNIFELAIPTTCPEVPDAILNPRDTWKDKEAYDKMADKLLNLFKDNYKKYQ